MTDEKTKICFKCNIEKPLSDFYTHKRMADGHLGKCKVCTQDDTKKRTDELSKDENWVKEERKRHRKKYYRLNYKEKHKPPPERAKEEKRRFRTKYPEKRKAVISSQCIEKLSEEVHHWSYNEEHFKDVVHLTKKEHMKAHRFLVYDQEFKMYRRIDNNELLDTKKKHEEYIRWVILNEED